MLDVLFQNVDRRAATTGSEVRRRPQHAFPIACCQVRSFPSQHSAGHTLERVHQMRQRDLRRIPNQQVDVVVLSVHLDKFGVEVGAYSGENRSKSVDRVSVQYSVSILCDEDQMCVHCENAVSTSCNVLMFGHRPSIVQARRFAQWQCANSASPRAMCYTSSAIERNTARPSKKHESSHSKR